MKTFKEYFTENTSDKTLLIARGLPSGGKSTTVKTLVPKDQIFSTDDFWGPEYNFDVSKLRQAHEWNQKRTEAAMINNITPIAVDNTNIKWGLIRPYAEMAQKYGYTIKYIESNSPWWKAFSKLLENPKNKTPDNPEFMKYIDHLFELNKQTHNVPKQTLINMAISWTPTKDLPKISNITEATVTQQLSNWDQILANNSMLQHAVELMKEIKMVKPDAEIYIVGGAVRDIVMKKEPHDIDITTNVDISIIEQNFKTANIGKSKSFGIVAVNYKGDIFEIANFRIDSYDQTANARHPTNVNITKSFEKDTERRDFTINQLGLTENGEIVDYQGGLDDIKNKILRTVGNPKERFKEDALRIYRLLRFASKMGFSIDPETKAAAIELNKLTDTLATERVSDELYKAAGSGKSLAKYIQHLDETGLLEKILPEVKAMQNFQHDKLNHPEGGVFDHILSALNNSRSNDPLTNIAIMLHDIAKPATYKDREGKHTYYGHDMAALPIIDKIGQRLKLKTDDINAIKFAAQNHMKIHNLDKMGQKKVTDLVNHPYWQILKDVSYADEMSRLHLAKPEKFNTMINNAENIAAKSSAGGGKEGLRLRIKEFVNGNRLMQWIPDLVNNKPLIGQILNNIQEWLVDNDFRPTENDIKQYALKTYNELKTPPTLESVYENMTANMELM